MKAGSIWEHKHFICKNGTELEKKYIIILNTPPQNEIPYFACLATSQGKKKPQEVGCNTELGYFKIKAAQEWFPRDTWLVLNDIYEFKYDYLLKNSLEKGNLRKISKISTPRFRVILKCVEHCRDVTFYQKTVIRACTTRG
jgi:hypothetical protein